MSRFSSPPRGRRRPWCRRWSGIRRLPDPKSTGKSVRVSGWGRERLILGSRTPSQLPKRAPKFWASDSTRMITPPKIGKVD
ncbi:hypothetical protein GDO78_022993 [Eleutherodactylus coqui]|uniref:Uncharacterized protein n=1 Tax=Eleutherodactylus coqui TaxID=57060 RepID=A0A8J6E4Q7_ELECQ|nr:hypothetical protein GDO78_022993 [Eleutherodactylus coqui]